MLVVDDILDEGETLHAIKQRVMELGASKFYSAVFADKENGKTNPSAPILSAWNCRTVSCSATGWIYMARGATCPRSTQ